MDRFKNGKLLKTILIVCLLCMFALIAGLSASVVRAVTMFTAVAIGMSFDRKTMVIHSLITSLFVLLLLKPMFLFEVGFQLSYLAVFSIVWIQPKMYNLWKPKWKLIDKFWQLFTVSSAAQLGVLPISLFYFHQFSGLFMLSNLVIIPFIGTILMGGIVVIALSLVQMLPQFFADGYGFIISLMNAFVSWISEQESFLIEEISFSFLMMLTTYLCLLLAVLFLIHKSPTRSILLLISFVLFQSVLLYEKKRSINKQHLVIFHKSRYTVIGERTGRALRVYYDEKTLNGQGLYMLKPYAIGEQVTSISYKQVVPSIIKILNVNLLVIDSLGIYQIKGLKNVSILLRQSPKINLERLLKMLIPKEVIADESNYKSLAQQWETVYKKNNIPFYYTGKYGAKILK